MPLILQLLEGKNQSESVLESPDMSKTQSGRLYLASNSPRRRELLSLCGWEYETLSSEVDETPLPGEDGKEYVQRLAKSKLVAAAPQVKAEGVIIAADTSVIGGGGDGDARILGKPSHPGEAVEILRELRGEMHQVHTAISILSIPGGAILSDLCTTDVPMRTYSDEEIQAYVATGDPLDKAGAYAIQHASFHPVEKLEGCYANVMGLPLCHLTRTLKKIGMQPLTDVPQACQAALGYACPVFSQILEGKI